MTTKQVKVLYVCPFAHYTGHFPWAAAHETQALARAGAEVELLTFCGVVDEAEVEVPQLTVRSCIKLAIPIYYLATFLGRWGATRWFSMFLEVCLTLAVAVRLKRKLNYDIIHLRDGEPFLFLPHLLSLPFQGYNWAISLTASNIYPPPIPSIRPQNLGLLIYTIALKFINSRLWRPLYRVGLARNRFVFLTQNETSQRDYSSYLQGVFDGKVVYLPLGTDSVENVISKEEARQHLGLPQGKPVLLSFGAPHSGKDLETVLHALKDLPEVYFVHAGRQAFGLGINLEEVAMDYIDADRMSIRNYYIPESEKPYYFFAADAAIISYARQFLSTTSLLWESCRFGTPAIASDNGQLKKLMEAFQPGLLFTAQDAASLRQAIIHFINLKPEEIQAMKDNCRRFSHEFSMEKWAQKCLDIYDSLLIR